MGSETKLFEDCKSRSSTAIHRRNPSSLGHLMISKTTSNQVSLPLDQIASRTPQTSQSNPPIKSLGPFGNAPTEMIAFGDRLMRRNKLDVTLSCWELDRQGPVTVVIRLQRDDRGFYYRTKCKELAGQDLRIPVLYRGLIRLFLSR